MNKHQYKLYYGEWRKALSLLDNGNIQGSYYVAALNALHQAEPVFSKVREWYFSNNNCSIPACIRLRRRNQVVQHMAGDDEFVEIEESN